MEAQPHYITRKLTAREQQIVDLYRAGKSFKEIGAELGLNKNGIGGRLHCAKHKLGLQSIEDLRKEAGR